jgi:FtsH-binding integral membrane protein
MNTVYNFFSEYVLIPTANAQTSLFVSFLGRVNKHIINPLIVLLFTAALVYFVLGLFKLMKKDDSKALEEGKQHMLWGIVGMAIMVSVFGIMSFITTTIGVGKVDPENSADVSGLFKN